MSAYVLLTMFLLAWRSSSSLALAPTHRPLSKFPPVHNVRVQLVNTSAVIIRWEKPQNITNNYIDYYKVHVRYTMHEQKELLLKDVPPPVDHELVTNLSPSILYSLRVAVIYTNRRLTYSDITHFNTHDPNVTEYCLCDPYGSSNSSLNNGTCINNKLDCRCLENYTGSRCAICVGGHYRQPGLPCTKCPCQPELSSGDCEYDGHLKRPRCTVCKSLKTGPLCEICQRGYFQDPANKLGCWPCSCPPIDAHLAGACDPRTGTCLHCPNGTAGPRCEHCDIGWAGAPPHCRPISSSALPRHSGLTLLASVLAAAAVAVALGLGYWVMRLRARQKRLNAWSLELNRYELEHPGIIDSGSQSGLMMEEAAPGYGGAGESVGPTAPPPPMLSSCSKDDQLIFRAARLQLRHAEPPPPGGPLV